MLKKMCRIPIYKLNSNYLSSIYNSGRWIDGVKIKRLEEKIKEFLNVKYVVLTNSGTSALLAAYWVLKNEYCTLTVDPYTFPATYQPARLLSYRTKFVRTILNKNSLPKIDSLFVATHLFGQPNKILDHLIIHSKPFVEDACQSFGARFKGRSVGTFGKMGCFSFYPTKPFHTNGHGGAVVTNNETYYQNLKIFIESGRIEGEMTDRIALNLRLDEIKAEYLLYELKSLSCRIELQRQIASEFKKLITDDQPFLDESEGDYHVFSVFNLLVKNRDNFRKHMQKYGIETMVYYNEDILPIKERSKYRDLTSIIVAIPCRWNLSSAEIRLIKKALRSWFK